MSKSMEQEKADANVSGELVFRVFYEIGIIAQLSTTRFERSLPYGMSRPQFSILNWFCRVDDQASPGRLAQAMEVTKGAITNSLKKLEAKNFITVSPDENSGRQKVVRLTPEGRRARDEAILCARPAFEQISQSLPAEALITLIPELEKIRKVLDESRI